MGVDILIYVGGVIAGSIITTIIMSKKQTHGVIDVDHDTEQLIIHVTSDDLKNRNTKYAVLKINHDAVISQDKHSL